jgi:ammonium transporter
LAVPGSRALADDSPDAPATKKDVNKVNDAAADATAHGDVAWMLMSTGLVLFMVPGLALFYGGMVRQKNLLGTMMQSMVALGLVGLQWVLIGYCLAFGETQGGWIGWRADLLGLQGILSWDSATNAWVHNKYPGTSIPILLHCMYQGMFAIITPALISGAVAERIRFGPYCLFILLWATVVYAPLAHWVWAVKEVTVDGETKVVPSGWLGAMGALDFAGGTVVHIAAGFSSLAAILVLRKRLGYPEHVSHPNSMVLTLLGAGLLWFGWFGFNGGSALASNGLAVSALAASQLAAAAAAMSWMVIEWWHRGKPTALGFASGLVAGLVAVTPASGFVLPWQALLIGLIAGGVCYGMVCLKPLLGYDDSLDAFGVHGIGGFLGALLTGVFGTAMIYQAGVNDMAPVGKLPDVGTQLSVQLVTALVSAGFSFGVTLVLVKGIDLLCGGFCLDARAESEGLDRMAHGEVAFDLGPTVDVPAERAHFREPRSSMVPPNGQKRFTVVVEGVPTDELTHIWSQLCQAGAERPSTEFLTVYPYVTTVQGNRFRFRGGDPAVMRESLQRLFQQHFHGSLQTSLESGPGNGRGRSDALASNGTPGSEHLRSSS